MIRATTIDLIAETPHGVFEEPVAERRTVFAEVKSVRMSEFYKALDDGIEPAYVFVLTDYADYNGEKVCEYNGTRYRIVRAYTKDQRIELTVEREAHNDN